MACAPVVAQRLRVSFQHVATGERRDDPVRCIAQDTRGFVWVGTRYGLRRFDDASFVPLDVPGSDSSFRPSSAVSSLAVARDGGLWLGTDHGLAYVAPGSSAPVPRGPRVATRIDLIRNRIDHLCVDRRGRVWILAAGLSRYDPQSNELHELSDAELAAIFGRSYGRGVRTVASARTDAEGAVWLLARDGRLVRIDPDNGRSHRFEEVPAALGAIAGARLHHEDGVAWIATDRGLFRFDPEAKTCVELRDGRQAFTGKRRVTCVLRDRDGRIWVGTHGAGLFLFEVGAAAAHRFGRDPGGGTGLPDDAVRSLFQDRSGAVWVGTVGGLCRCDGRRRFRFYEVDRRTGSSGGRAVRAIHKEPDGTVWFGHGTVGLLRIDPDGTSRTYAAAPGDLRALRDGRVSAIAPADGGRLWLGTRKGLHLFDRERGVLRVYTHDPGDPASISSSWVRALHRAPSGELWLGTSTGIDRLDPDTGKVQRVELPRGAAVARQKGVIVGGLFPDRGGELWAILIGTRMLRIDSASARSESVALRAVDRGEPPPGAIFAVLPREEHLLLAARAGVYRCGRDGTGLRSLGERTGLALRSAATILPASGGGVWVGTSFDGLLLLDERGDRVRAFNYRDGIAGEAIYAGSGHRAPDGEILLSCGNGLLRFDERDVLRASPAPAVIVRELRVRGRPTPWVADAELELGAGDDSFSLDLAALDFVDPVRNRFAYRLEGVDPDWVHSGTGRTVRYTNVAPGRYVFRAKAANADGVWSPADLTMRIRVLAPFWGSWWFRSAAVLVIVFVLGTYLLYARALARRGRRVQEEYEERMRAEAAARQLEAQLHQSQKMEAVGRLAGGVAHDFNNILTSILGYSELALKSVGNGAASAEAREGIAEIRRGAERGAALTRQLLAFSRNQPLRPAVLAVNAMIHELEGMLRRIVRENIELELRLGDDLPAICADKGQFGQVVLNLVVNASDAMPSGGRVEIATRASQEFVEIEVTDTGRGMSAEELECIFEPFYTTKPVGQGTGLGLATVHGIVTQSGGKVRVSSQPGAGSSLRVLWPVASEAPASGEVAAAVATGGTETVLVCEDDPVVLELTSKLLRHHGYRVIDCSSPDAALRAAQADGSIDLMISDVVMPRMNGPELAAAVRARRPEIGLMFVSGYAADGKASLPPDSAYLAKPFTATELLATTRSALDRPAAG